MNGTARWVTGQRRQSSVSSTAMMNSVPLRPKNYMSHGLFPNQRKPLIGRAGKCLSPCRYIHTCGKRSTTMTQRTQYVVSTSVGSAHVLSRLCKVYSCMSASSIHLHSFLKVLAMFQATSALEGTLGLLSP